MVQSAVFGMGIMESIAKGKKAKQATTFSYNNFIARNFCLEWVNTEEWRASRRVDGHHNKLIFLHFSARASIYDFLQAGLLSLESSMKVPKLSLGWCSSHPLAGPSACRHSIALALMLWKFTLIRV